MFFLKNKVRVLFLISRDVYTKPGYYCPAKRICRIIVTSFRGLFFFFITYLFWHCFVCVKVSYLSEILANFVATLKFEVK